MENQNDNLQNDNLARAIIARLVGELRPITELKINPEQEKILSAPVPPEKIQIRSDGQVYLPWEFYARRMNEAFGRTGWMLLPITDIISVRKPNGWIAIRQEYILSIQGCIVDIAWGDHEYDPAGARMTETEAIEACQSVAIRRLVGKRLGVGLELWDNEYIEEWIAEHAECVEKVDPKTGRKYTEWRKTTSSKKSEEKRVKELVLTRPVLTRKEKLNRIIEKSGKNITELREEMKEKFGVTISDDLTENQVDEWLRQYENEEGK